MEDFDIADAAAKWVREAGRRAIRLRSSLGSSLVYGQGLNPWGSRIDIEIERLLKRRIRAMFPHHGLIGDDVASINPLHPVWILKPIDARHNFARGFPSWATTICLIVDGRPKVCAIYDATIDDVIVAWSGGGAWRGRERLRVGAGEGLDRCLVATETPRPDGSSRPVYLREFMMVQGRVQGLRQSGSLTIDLIHLAARQVDAFWTRECSAYALAAGGLVASESGCRFTARDGRSLLDSSAPFFAVPGLHDVLIGLLEDAAHQRRAA